MKYIRKCFSSERFLTCTQIILDGSINLWILKKVHVFDNRVHFNVCQNTITLESGVRMN